MIDWVKYYRYEDHLYSSGDEDYGFRTYVKINLYEFDLIRNTPKGVWINLHGNPKFILTKARKHYACPTKEEAMQSFIARKNRQLRILKSKVRYVENALRLVGITND